MSNNSRHAGMRMRRETSEDLPPVQFDLPKFVSAEAVPELMSNYALDRSWLIRSTPTISESDVKPFFDMVNSGDQPSMIEAISSLQSQGVTSEQLLLELLPKVTEELDQRWTADETDFGSVTIALGHLQTLRRMIAQIDTPGMRRPGPPRRALLATAPGEQHNFGLMIVDHLMHLAGWDVRTCPAAGAEEIIRLVTKNHFEIAGLSLSCESYLMSLERLVSTIRRVSKNKNIGILVGGPLFLERPELALLIGADATALDGKDAVMQAERIALNKAMPAGLVLE